MKTGEATSIPAGDIRPDTPHVDCIAATAAASKGS